ncbi:MAG: hypothetical protein ACLQGT_06895 [Terracidiphilus sp.]
MNDAITPLPVRSPASSPAPAQRVSGFERAASAVRLALPLVQRLLPLLDGNVGSAVSNLLTPHAPAHPPATPVNLEPIENGLAEVQVELRDLHGQLLEQNVSLKRIEDRLDQASEATASNSIALQEQMEELKAAGRRVETLRAVGQRANLFALVALGLLALSVALNVLLVLHFRHFLP